MRVTRGLTRFETAVFARLPYFVANGVTKLAHGTHKYLDILIDKTLYLAAKKTLARSSKIGRTHDETLQRSIAAALLGFLIIVIIVIATGLG
jgi:preprotein translocase subunit SecF